MAAVGERTNIARGMRGGKAAPLGTGTGATIEVTAATPAARVQRGDSDATYRAGAQAPQAGEEHRHQPQGGGRGACRRGKAQATAARRRRQHLWPGKRGGAQARPVRLQRPG